MEPQLRKHLVETVKKKLGLPENKITMKPELRERLKNALRPLVVEALKQNKALLNEITYTTFKSTPQKQLATTLVEKFNKALKATFDGATVEENTNNGKILFQDGKGGCCFDVEVVPMSKDNYRVEAIVHGGSRFVALNLTEDQVVDFIKKDLKEFVDAGTYTEQAYAKNAIPENKEVTKEKADQDEPDDEMKEVKGEKKQADHKPLEPKERKDGAHVVGTPGMKTIKVKKQEDAPSKEKVTLKADKENASKEKVVQKLDDTPTLKEGVDDRKKLESLLTEVLDHKRGHKELYEFHKSRNRNRNAEISSLENDLKNDPNNKLLKGLLQFAKYMNK